MYNGTNQRVTTYLRGANLISDGTNYYLHNAHGDVTMLANAGGAVIKTYDYDAFGNQLNTVAEDTNPFRYCGEYYDSETENYYLRARYYDPGVGRFTQQDTHWNTANMIYGDTVQKLNVTVDAEGGEYSTAIPQLLAIRQAGNLYGYAVNNPVAYIDPTGRWTIGIGGNLSAAYGLRVGLTSQIVFDGNGNIGILVSPAVGAGTPTAGGGVVVTFTTAKEIAQLSGIGVEAGISVSGLPIFPPNFGLEGIAGSGFVGVNLSFGLAAQPWAEGHGEISYTIIIPLRGKKAENVKKYVLEQLLALGDMFGDENLGAIINFLGFDYTDIHKALSE